MKLLHGLKQTVTLKPSSYKPTYGFTMKKVLAASVLAVTAAFCMNASAQTNTGTLNVAVTLTPKCVINNAATGSAGVITAIGMTYSSFQAGVSNGSTSFQVRCATGLSFSTALDSALGVSSGISYFAALGAAAATGITADSLTLASQAGTAAAGGTTIFVNTTAPASQAGTTTASTQARVVTLTF